MSAMALREPWGDSCETGKEKNMGVALERGEESSTIRLEGVIDIALAGELREALLKALTSGKELRISLEGATDLDVTAMQLLWAARRMADTSNVKLEFNGPVQERVSASFAEVGLERFVPGDVAS
jgi:anti-anti-sigma regulatory factor